MILSPLLLAAMLQSAPPPPPAPPRPPRAPHMHGWGPRMAMHIHVHPPKMPRRFHWNREEGSGPDSAAVAGFLTGLAGTPTPICGMAVSMIGNK